MHPAAVPTRNEPPEPVAGEDWNLVLQVRKGEMQAFVALMRRHNQRLYRIARSVLDNAAEAEDAVQETYLKAYAKLDAFRGPAGFATWIGKIALNEARGRLRARRRVVSIERHGEEADDGSGNLAVSLKSQLPDPERLAMNSQFRLLLEASLDKMPEEFRTVFVLRMIEGMSVAETAQVLSLSPVTVKTRLHRARQRLQKLLGATLEDLMPVAHRFDGQRCDRIVAKVVSRVRSDNHAQFPRPISASRPRSLQKPQTSE